MVRSNATTCGQPPRPCAEAGLEVETALHQRLKGSANTLANLLRPADAFRRTCRLSNNGVALPATHACVRASKEPAPIKAISKPEAQTKNNHGRYTLARHWCHWKLFEHKTQLRRARVSMVVLGKHSSPHPLLSRLQGHLAFRRLTPVQGITKNRRPPNATPSLHHWQHLDGEAAFAQRPRPCRPPVGSIGR